MRYFVAATLLIGGVIHLLPVLGVLGTSRLNALYGISFEDPNLAILMRHRAVLFGIVAGLMILAFFKPSLRLLAFSVGLLSAGSFLLLAWSVGGYNARLSAVVAADILAVMVLLAGAAVHARMGPT